MYFAHFLEIDVARTFCYNEILNNLEQCLAILRELFHTIIM